MAAINFTDLELEFGKHLPEVLKEREWIPIRENIKDAEKKSTIGVANIEWLNSAPIDNQPRAYQREKVAGLLWKQELLVSVIEKVKEVDCVVLNMIHIRIVEKDGEVYYELIDGQQRVTSITDFVNNKFALGNNFMVGDLVISGSKHNSSVDWFLLDDNNNSLCLLAFSCRSAWSPLRKA